MTEYNYSKNITSKDCEDCSDKIVDKLETKFNCKLKALNDSDTVNGSITIKHIQNNHKITVEFYSKNELANKNHSTKFIKIQTIPTKQQIENNT